MKHHLLMRLSLSLMILLFPFDSLYATHQMGGHIEMEHLNGLEYRLTVKTFSDPAPAGVDRCSADIEVWQIDANGTATLITSITDIPRSNGLPATNPGGDCNITTYNAGETVYNQVKRNLYETTYTFPSSGQYELRYRDFFRTASILNIPNPDESPLYLSLGVVVDTFYNQPPQLLNESIFALACASTPWQYNPIAFDPDGDSLVYELEPVWEYEPPTNPQMVNGFQYPDDSSFGGGSFTINSSTGLIDWVAPSQIGLYVVAIRIKAYQNGSLQSETLQEIPIIVTDCGNVPPDFVQGGGSGQDLAFPGQSISYSMTVVPASQNDSLYVDFQLGDRPSAGWFNNSQSNFSMLVTAQDANQGTFTQTSLPVAVLNSANSPASVQIEISWTPGPEDIGKDYQFDLIAHNNLSYLNQPMQAMLSAYQSLRFKVAKPVPIGVSAAPNSWDGITISWTDLPYDTAALFMIYRIKDTMPELSLPCAVREDTTHFEYLGYTTSWAPYTFGYAPMGIVDETLCYVVTAAKGSIWNITEESCPSEIGCVENFTTDLETEVERQGWYLEAPEGLDAFVLRSYDHRQRPIQFQVLDTQGKSVLRSSSQKAEVMVSTTSLSQGIYWVQIWEDGQQYSLPYWKR